MKPWIVLAIPEAHINYTGSGIGLLGEGHTREEALEDFRARRHSPFGDTTETVEGFLYGPGVAISVTVTSTIEISKVAVAGEGEVDA